ncbi:MAG: hypothetical protein U0795_09055 [Pirellulales bacterium]
MQDRRQSEAIEIQTRMAAVRTGARRQLDQVVHHAQQLTDWRVQARRHPMLTAGALATLGYFVSTWLAGRTARTSSPPPPYPPYDPLSVMAVTAGMAGSPARGDTAGQDRDARESDEHDRRVEESSLSSTVVKMIAGVVAQHLARLAMNTLTEWLTKPVPPAGTASTTPEVDPAGSRASELGA